MIIEETGDILHYTCNAPKYDTLEINNIRAIGDKFECADPREVLIIPKNLYESRFGRVGDEREIIGLNSEILLKKLDMNPN